MRCGPSGLDLAGELAMRLHLPLYILSEKGIIEPGCGYRLMGHEKPGSGPILVIDDSRSTGRSQQQAMPIARKYWPSRKLLYAVLYRNMLAMTPPLRDFWVRESNAIQRRAGPAHRCRRSRLGRLGMVAPCRPCGAVEPPLTVAGEAMSEAAMRFLLAAGTHRSFPIGGLYAFFSPTCPVGWPVCDCIE